MTVRATDAFRAIGRFATRPWVQRLLPWLLFAIMAALLARLSGSVDWSQVTHSIRNYDAAVIMTALGLTALTYLIYSTFDLLGRYYTGASLSTVAVMRTAFISYAFNLSLGSLIGGIAFRFRLYAHLGLDAATTSKIIFLSVLTNWLGYSVIAGAIFLSGALAIPGWNDSGASLRVIGAILLCTASAYLLLCARRGGRNLSIAGRTLRVPRLNLALMQLLLSVIHWPTAAGILFALVDGSIAYPEVLAALLLSAIAGLLVRIPAGIGVLEGVFFAAFGDRVPINELLAALLVFRAAYYLAPLAVAVTAYLTLEARSKRDAEPERKPSSGNRPPPTVSSRHRRQHAR